MIKSEQIPLPYDMGNAGDLLKHGILAEFLRTRLIFQRTQSVRFLDLFAGEPFSSDTCDEIVQRVGNLSECALHEAQPDISSGRYYGSGMLARKLGDCFGGRVSVVVADCDEGRHERFRESRFTMLEDEFPQLRDSGRYDAYAALEVIRHETTSKDLILIDPFADFLKPNQHGFNRAESIFPNNEPNKELLCSYAVSLEQGSL